MKQKTFKDKVKLYIDEQLNSNFTIDKIKITDKTELFAVLRAKKYKCKIILQEDVINSYFLYRDVYKNERNYFLSKHKNIIGIDLFRFKSLNGIVMTEWALRQISLKVHEKLNKHKKS